MSPDSDMVVAELTVEYYSQTLKWLYPHEKAEPTQTRLVCAKPVLRNNSLC